MLTNLLSDTANSHTIKQPTDLEHLTKDEQLALGRAQQDEPAQIVKVAPVDLKDFIVFPHEIPAHRVTRGLSQSSGCQEAFMPQICQISDGTLLVPTLTKAALLNAGRNSARCTHATPSQQRA